MKRIEDGKTVDTDAAAMEPLPEADGVFETLLLRSGQPVFWHEHWLRFVSGCERFGLPTPGNRDELAVTARQLAEINGLRAGVLRLATWKKDRHAVTWRLEVGGPREHMLKPELRANWSETILPPANSDRQFKHLRRGTWLAALRVARAAGYDESLLRSASGSVVEGCVSNVFLVRDERIVTPAASSGLMPGIVRSLVIRIAETAGWDVAEQDPTRLDFESADEVWLTNSLIGVRPLSELAGITYRSERVVLNRLRTAWQQRFGWDVGALPE